MYTCMYSKYNEVRKNCYNGKGLRGGIEEMTLTDLRIKNQRPVSFRISILLFVKFYIPIYYQFYT